MDELITFTMLTKFNSDKKDEIRRYMCSHCNDDVYNINVHAQMIHNSLNFEISTGSVNRYSVPPTHPCGVKGCSYLANHGGGHSWEPHNA